MHLMARPLITLHLRRVHDGGAKVVPDAPLIHEALDLAHVSAVIIPSVMGHNGRDIAHGRELALRRCDRPAQALRHLESSQPDLQTSPFP